MARLNRQSSSIWMTVQMPKFSPLLKNVDCDVCVIGSGITGLSTAYLLSKRQFSVCVLDDGPIVSGETQRTTAHLTNVVDDRYFEIEKTMGTKKTRLIYESHTAALDLIEDIVVREQLDCDFERLNAYLFLGKGQPSKILDNELASLRRIGFPGVDLQRALPFGLSRLCLRFANQAQFHPLKYLKQLCQRITKNGGIIYTQTHAREIKDGDSVIVRTSTGRQVRAKFLVVATNSPISDWVKVHTKQAAYRSYVIAAPIADNTLPKALYWDTEEPYHYVRLADKGNGAGTYIIVGGEDHKTGQSRHPEKSYEHLESWAREFLPPFKQIEFAWSGQIIEPVDGVAFIGRDPAHGPNVFIATGDSGMGMTHGTMAGIIITDLIEGKANPWAQIYDPKRKPTADALRFVAENVNAVSHYFGIIGPGDGKAESEIQPGEGAILSSGAKKFAVYKNLQNKTRKFSALCPHLKSLLQWNSVEKTWDCPTHGSRFTCEGKVINGPANSDMEPVSSIEDDEPTIKIIDEKQYDDLHPHQ